MEFDNFDIFFGDFCDIFYPMSSAVYLRLTRELKLESVKSMIKSTSHQSANRTNILNYRNPI